MNERVVLLDQSGDEIGTANKLLAHQQGWLHRAVSVFVFDNSDRLLLQRRAAGKYHSGGLWTNTCCGHPRSGEAVQQAAERRLLEEMGLALELREVHRFQYRAVLANGLYEHELDHVFVGLCEPDRQPRPDAAEVEAWTWVDVEYILALLERAPHVFTAWFSAALSGVLHARRQGLPGAVLPQKLPQSPQLGQQQTT